MPRIDDIRTPGTMSMNLDADLSLLGEAFYREAYNIRNGMSSDDNSGALEAIKGNTVVQTMNTIAQVVGRYVDLENGYVYLFVTRINNWASGIYRYTVATNELHMILFDEVLNFKEDYLINHIDMVDGKLLYWTDNINPPRKLNVEKAFNYTNNINVSALNRYFKNVSRSEDRIISILDQIIHPPLYGPDKYNGLDDSVPGGIIFTNGFGTDTRMEVNMVQSYLWQFRYRYVYDDHQKSVWSPCSKVFFDNQTDLANGMHHANQSINNVIGLTINTGHEEVNHIEIAVRTDRVGKWKLCDRLYKYDTIGNVLIQSEIDFLYKFYNNTDGESLDQADVNRDFHLIPKLSKSQTVIEKNRLVHANILEGSDSVTPDVNLKLKFSKKFNDDYYYIDIPTLLNQNYEWRIDLPSITYPNSVYVVVINRIGSNDYWTAQVICEETDTPDTMKSKMMAALENLDYIYLGNYTLIVSIAASIVIGMPYSFFIRIRKNPPFLESCKGVIYLKEDNHLTFKSGSWHEFGLRYFDRGGRACSVSTNDECKIYIPYFPKLVSQKIISNKPIHQIMIDWEINHIPPIDAVTCRWYRKKNSIEYFFDFYLPDINIKVLDDRAYYIINPLINNVTSAWKNSTLEQYIWQKNDRIRFYGYREVNTGKSYYLGEDYDFEILGVDFSVFDTVNNGYLLDEMGEFIYDDFGNKVRDTSKQSLIVRQSKLPFAKGETSKFVYYIEIYRKRKELVDDSDLWFEFGEELQIINAGTENRRHGKGYDDNTGWARDQVGILSARGTFVTGDVYLKLRYVLDAAVPVESSWFSDFFNSNLNDDGKFSVINKEYREKRFPNLLRYGGLFIQDSYVNDLLTFIGGDLEILSEKFGEINLIREYGYTLKVRCANKIVSLYIGRAGLQQASVSQEAGEVVVASERILGTQWIPDNIYGCINAESEVTHGNDSYFVDIVNGYLLRDSKNGILPISKFYGIHNHIKNLCKSLHNNCKDVRIVGGYDEAFDELWYSFYGRNKVTGEVVSETIVFFDPDNSETKGFKTFVDLHDGQGYTPNWIVSVGQRTFVLLKNQIAEQNTNALYANFFGVQYQPKIKMIFNKSVNLEKVFKVLSYDGELEWECPEAGDVLIPSSYANNEMWSILPIERIKSIKGIKYADFGRNMLSTSDKPTIKDLVSGQDLRGRLLILNLVGRNTGKCFLRWIKVESVTSELTG